MTYSYTQISQYLSCPRRYRLSLDMGSVRNGKTRLLRFLRCLCRRAVVLSDLTPSTLYLLTNQIAATLLLDEFDESSGCGGAPCKLCQEFGLNVDHDGNPLKCVAPEQPRRDRSGLFEPWPE
jgi:hypothetical protein